MRKYLLVSVLLLLIVFVYYAQAVKKQKTLGVSDISERKIVGLIIPHHDLAASLIIDSLDKIKNEGEYKRVVIIGPNHFFPERETVITSAVLSDYPIDEEVVGDLNNQFKEVVEDEAVVANEHSVGIPMKYIREIYPQASFIPLVISPYYNQNSLEAVSGYLSGNLSEDTLFVLAVDFAHNLGIDEALSHNDITIDAIRNFDTQAILDFSDEYLDSPVATVMFLKIMERLGAGDWQLISSTHGSMLGS